MTHATESEHIWFTDHVPAALANGLGATERSRFESHASDCSDCAAALRDIGAADASYRALFADAKPSPGLEDRVITRLRESNPRRMIIPPIVRYAMTGLAAAIVLAGFGLFWTRMINPENHPAVTQAVGHIGDADSAMLRSKSIDVGGPDVRSTDAISLSFDSPFRGIQRNEARDKIFTKSENDEKSATGQSQIALGPQDSNDSILLPTDDENGAVAEPGVTSNVKPLAGFVAETGKDNLGRKSELSYSYRNDAPAPTTPAPAEEFKPNLGLSGRAGGKVGDGTAMALGDVGFGISKHAEEVSAKPKESEKPKTGENLPVLLVMKNGDVATEDLAAPAATQPAAVSDRKIIRDGQMEFEVESFDAAFMQVSKIVAEDGGFVAATESQKLSNGKVSGVVNVRVPPDRLDVFVLKLRALGDLKGMKIGSTDVTKQYVDLESELKADRAMEERLLDIIKTGKGEIKDLVAAEKELGGWRGKIEKIEGEIRYYNNLVSMATLAITLSEKDIKTPTFAAEIETVNAGVECQDVEKARSEALKAVDDAKGRIVQSDLKKFEAGQFAATIVADVPPDASGPLIDRLKQIGKVARLDVERHLDTQGGSGAPTPAVKVERRDTRFTISLYNLANVAPRQTTSLNLAADDVEKTYRAILDAIAGAAGTRVVNSNLDRPKPDETTGTIHFESPADQSDALLQSVRGFGEVMRLAVTENPDTQNATTTKRGFTVQIFALATVAPRETMTLRLAAKSVPETYNAILSATRDKGARMLASQLNEQDRQNVTALLDFEIRRADQSAIDKLLSTAGTSDVIARNIARSADAQNTVDSKVRMQVTLLSADRVPPRETRTLSIETPDVEKAVQDFLNASSAAGGRTVESRGSTDNSGHVDAKVVVDVPLAKLPEVLGKAKSLGTVRVNDASRNAQVPDGSLAIARLDITLDNGDRIVGADAGLWNTIRASLGTSVAGLLWSVRLIVIGLCLAGPWALMIWGGWKVARRRKRA